MPVSSSSVTCRHDTRALLERLRAVALVRSTHDRPAEFKSWVAAAFTHEGCRHEIVCARIAGAAAGHDPIRLGLFSGIHGDEPAGCAALVELASSLMSDPARVAGYELFLYPVINPVGCERGTRANHAGKD